jgi:hypothetical protein
MNTPRIGYTGHMPTLADDLVLLLIDPESGHPMVDGTSLDRGIGGALLLDLTLAGRISTEGGGARATLVVDDPRPTGDPLLDEAVARIGAGSVRARRAVEKLSKRVRKPVFGRLVAAGVVVEEQRRVLGLIPNTSWRTADPAPRKALVAAVAAVLLDGKDPDERTACLVSLLHALQAEHKVVGGSKRELRARAKQIADGEWAGAAVRQAIQDVRATVVTAVVVSGAASSAASGS